MECLLVDKMVGPLLLPPSHQGQFERLSQRALSARGHSIDERVFEFAKIGKNDRGQVRGYL